MFKMEYEENPANLHSVTRAASKKLSNLDAGTKSLKKINKSSMLSNVSESHGDIIYNVKMDVNKEDLRNAIQQRDGAAELKLDETMKGARSNFSKDADITSISAMLFNDRGDAAQLKLDEMMNNLLDILDETIDILQVVDVGPSDPLSFNDEYEDGSYYRITEFDQADLNSAVSVTETLNDDEEKSHQNEITSEVQAKTNYSADAFAIAKNISNKFNDLNEYAESFVILLMLFSLYFLLSALI